jgi:hypothetical protein
VIVRIAGEGQFRIPDEDQDRLNELDNAAVEAVEAGDEARFQELWGQMLALIESDGNALGDDELVASGNGDLDRRAADNSRERLLAVLGR